MDAILRLLQGCVIFPTPTKMPRSAWEESHLRTFLGRETTKKGVSMITRNVTLPELGLVAMSRAALGFGIGLLISERIETPQRRAIGWTLVTVGAVSTIPLALNFF